MSVPEATQGVFVINQNAGLLCSVLASLAELTPWKARRLPGSATMKTQVGRANLVYGPAALPSIISGALASDNHFGWLARRWTRLRSFWFRRTSKSKRPATKPKHSRPPWRRGQLSKESEDGRPCHDCRRDRASATQRDRAVQ